MLESSVTNNFSPSIQAIIREYSTKLRATEEVVITVLLSLLSILCNTTVTGRIGDREIQAALWLVLVGPSGTGKTPVQRAILDTFVPQDFVFRSGTRCGMESQLLQNRHLLWLADEVDTIKKWNSTEVVETLFPGYDGGICSRYTRNDQIFLGKIFVSILTNCTRLDHFIGLQQVFSGYAARFNAVSMTSDSSVNYAASISPETKSFLLALKEKFVRKEILFSPGALALYDVWLQELLKKTEKLRKTDVGSMYRKHIDRILRLAILIAASEGEEQIDTSLMLRAVRVGEWLLDEQEKAWKLYLGLGFDETSAEEALKTALSVVQSNTFTSPELIELVEKFGGPSDTSAKRAGIIARSLGLKPKFVSIGKKHSRVWVRESVKSRCY